MKRVMRIQKSCHLVVRPSFFEQERYHGASVRGKLDPAEQEADRIAISVTSSGNRAEIESIKRPASVRSKSIPRSVAQLISNPGRELNPSLRSEMESYFRHDFSHVRIYDGRRAELSARGVGADAYTVGNAIVFGQNRYAPDTRSGRQLLAHELTHVVQQEKAGVSAMQRQESSDALPPVPDVTLPRLSLFGPVEGEATLDGFVTNRADLTDAHRDQLRALVPNLRNLIDQPPGGRVQVVGHTDRVGSEAHNALLGQQRADAVRDELVRLGIDSAAIHASSLGEDIPAVDTEAAEPRNRRVEVYFTPNSGPDFRGIFTEGFRPSEPLRPAPSVDIPGVTRPFQPSDRCTLMPSLCRPRSGPNPDIFRPLPPIPERRLPSVSDAIWNPIDRALQRGLRDLGLSDEWNQRLRDAARAGAAKGATELLDQAMDAANLHGETREAVSAALRAAVQLEVPF